MYVVLWSLVSVSVFPIGLCDLFGLVTQFPPPPPPYPLAPLRQAQRSVLHVMREENRTSGHSLYQSPFFFVYES